MKFDLRSPCESCPFRRDVRPFLRGARALQIANYVLKRDVTFQCHKTTGLSRDKIQHCAGALLFNEKLGSPNAMIRLAHAFGLYDPARLLKGVEVFDSAKEMQSHHEGE